MRLLGLSVLIFIALVTCEPEQEPEPEIDSKLSEDPSNSTEAEPEILENISSPLFLVEFVNENSTDKNSKRTIDNNLGYGYLKNNLFSGKYNYYFPNGKTGTTVSIEESISPFEPKTIIEPEKPKDEWTASFPPNQQIFGQRTKLRKYNPSDYSHQQIYSTTPKPSPVYTTIRPDYNQNNQNSYTSPKTIYQNSFSAYSSTPTPPGYNSEYVAGLHPPGALEATTLNPPLSDDLAQFNIPRFTVENGVRYENKIVWKYPDGRVADPPSSYINHYSEYSEQRPKVAQNFRETNFRNQNQNQNLNNFERNKNNNIYSQRPATFPNDQESFSQRPGGTSQSQAFNLSYQNNFGYRRNNNNKFERPYSKYAVDSSNPEYTPAPNSVPRNTEAPEILTGGQLSPQLLNKYKPQVQQYLNKLFTSSKDKPESFIENNYEQLLNYNPSISQYVKDPSSILQAYPTFIQSGKSLVPVIILRVDGVRPVEQQTPNINLKSLLQQYLSQYASEGKKSQEFRPSPVDDLTYLTEALKRFSPKEPTRLANHPLEYESQRQYQESSYDTINSEVKPYNNNGNKFGKKSQKVKSVQIIDGPHYTN